jgi:hypothetical protein
MKKVLAIVSLMVMVLGMNSNSFAFKYQLLTGINIDFSTKAYWDGPSKSCLPREHGFCFHISFDLNNQSDRMQGTLDNSALNGLTLTFSKKTGAVSGVNELLKGGYFTMDGDATFSEELLMKLGLPKGYTIKAGKYPYSDNGSSITVSFNK